MGQQVNPISDEGQSRFLTLMQLMFIGTVSAVGKGFFRVMKINKDLISDIIPVDYPINLMIAVAWHTATRR